MIRYGYLPIAPDTSFFVAMEKGFFHEQGIEVEPIRLQSSNRALELLVSGRLDALAPVALEAALALETITPGEFYITEMAAATADTTVHRFVVRKDSPIQSLVDLRGKNIGTFPGSQTTVLLRLMLNNFFDADKDLIITQLQTGLQPQALITGQVDALYCLEPTGSQLELSGKARAISINPLYELILQPFPTAAGIISSRILEERPDIYFGIKKALEKAHVFIRSNAAEPREILSIYTPVSPEQAPHVGLYDYWDVENVDHLSLKQLVGLYKKHGIIDSEIDTNKLFYHSDSGQGIRK